jgi:hypothetical protein
MKFVTIFYHYKLISTNEKISEEILRSLPDLKVHEECEEIDINDPFHAAEIKRLGLPPDFVEAVYILSEKEFWDCYRYNTFKPFQRLPLLQKNPKYKEPLPKFLRTHKGYNYQNFIYKNRDHLLYVDRMELLRNMQFINTPEALIIKNYADVLEALISEDQERRRREDEELEQRRREDEELEQQKREKELELQLEKEKEEEERCAQKCYKLSGGMKY